MSKTRLLTLTSSAQGDQLYNKDIHRMPRWQNIYIKPRGQSQVLEEVTFRRMTRTEVDVKRTRYSRQYRALKKFSKTILKQFLNYLMAVHRVANKEEQEANGAIAIIRA